MVPPVVRLSPTCRTGAGGVGVGVSVELFVGDADVEGEEDLLVPVEGVADLVVSPDARAGGALPTTRTIPAPRTMTSGFRADRASTAHNLPIAPQRHPPRLTPVSLVRIMRSRESRSINRANGLITQQPLDEFLVKPGDLVPGHPGLVDADVHAFEPEGCGDGCAT